MHAPAEHCGPGKLRPLILLAALALLCAGLFSSCSTAMNVAAVDFSDNLAGAITDSDDPETVRQALPAYMIMLESMIRERPDEPDLNKAAADLYSAYAGLVSSDRSRQKLLTGKALGYALAALCAEDGDACGLDTVPWDDFSKMLGELGADRLPFMYTLGSSWAGWIAARPGDWDAIAQLSRVRALMDKVADLDPGYEHGQALVYLGVLSCLLPPAAGGKPEEGKAFFERALALSDGKNLMALVWYAKAYARSVGDKELFVFLLTRAGEADAKAPGLTLANTIAREEARDLLDQTEDFFPEL